MKFLARRLTASRTGWRPRIILSVEPFALASRPNRRAWWGKLAGTFVWSTEHQIDQREKGRSDRGSDQGVIGADVRIHLKPRLAGFLGHAGTFRAGQK